MADRIAKRVRVSGTVQGVWYRKWCAEQAVSLGVNGFVRNRLDGSVEALFVGKAKDVDCLIERCYHGPDKAVVDAIEIEDAKGFVPSRFEVKPTV